MPIISKRCFCILLIFMMLFSVLPVGRLYAKEPSESTYSVTLVPTQGGQLLFEAPDLGGAESINTKLFMPKETVVIDIKPEAGFHIASCRVIQTGPETVLYENIMENDGISFSMPEASIRVEAVFVAHETNAAESLPGSSEQSPEDEGQKENIVDAKMDADAKEQEGDDAVDLLPTDELETTKQYILTHMDTRLARANIFFAEDAITVKQTFAKKAALPPDRQTIDGLWSTDDNGHSFSDALITMNTNAVVLYNTDVDSAYYVAFVNPMIFDENIETKSVDFAKANYEGQVLSDCIYDGTTGLCYVPKRYLRESALLFQTQVQFLQLVQSEDETSRVQIEIDSNIGEETFASENIGEAPITSLTTHIRLTEDKALLKEISADEIRVFVNGAETPWESAEHPLFYDAQTGVISIPVAPTNISDVRIEIENVGPVKSVLEKVKTKLVSSLKGMSVQAAPYFGLKWADASTVLPYVWRYKGGIEGLQALKGKTIQMQANDNSSSSFTVYTDNPGAGGDYVGKHVASPKGDGGVSQQYTFYYDLYDLANEMSETGKSIPDIIGNSGSRFAQHQANIANYIMSTTGAPSLATLEAHLENLRSLGITWYGIEFPKTFNLKNPTDGSLMKVVSEPKSGADTQYVRNKDNGNLIIPLACAHIRSPLGFDNGDAYHTFALKIIDYDVDEFGAGLALIGVLGEASGNAGAVGGIGQTLLGVSMINLMPTQGKVTLQKSSAIPEMTTGNACYTFSGISYGIYATKEDAQEDTNRIDTFVCDAKGKTKTIVLEEGTYYYRELDAGTKATGYLLDDKVYSIKVAAAKLNTIQAKNMPSNDPIDKLLKKQNAVTFDTKDFGDAKLIGCEYTMDYYDVLNATLEDVTDRRPFASWVVQTDNEGMIHFNRITRDAYNHHVGGDGLFIAEEDTVVFGMGTYVIYETKAPVGYLLNPNDIRLVHVNPDETEEILSLYTVNKPNGDMAAPFNQEPVLGGVEIQKHDAELLKSESLGGVGKRSSETGATLSDVSFTIYNRSDAGVTPVDKKGNAMTDKNGVMLDIAPGEAVLTIQTKWDKNKKAYIARTGARALPFGRYSIRETDAKSYLLSDEEKFFTIEEDSVIVDTDNEGNPLVYENFVKRRDIEGEKVEGKTMKRLSVAFLITNVTTGEKHVVISDENGEIDTSASWNPHTFKTNANDALLSYVSKGEVIPTSAMNSNSGVYFGKGEAGSVAPANDERGAFIYGDYIMEELPCEDNVDHELVTIKFRVSRDSDKPLDLSTITDDVIEPEDSVPVVAPSPKTGDSSMPLVVILGSFILMGIIAGLKKSGLVR